MAHASTHQANRIVKNAAETVGIQGILYVDSNGVERKKATAHTLRHSSPFVISKEGGRKYKGPDGIHPARNNDAVPSIPRGNKNAARKVAAETFEKFQCFKNRRAEHR